MCSPECSTPHCSLVGTGCEQRKGEKDFVTWSASSSDSARYELVSVFSNSLATCESESNGITEGAISLEISDWSVLLFLSGELKIWNVLTKN
ncbi:hypothetical protein J6590_020602 [Homalodisca vitripennis]|nr:hypothetical protein J6590_020602 [Homalodisca vitripennis]